MMSKAPWIILFTAIIFIALGLMRNELAVVLGKGTKLCLECVGIG